MGPVTVGNTHDGFLNAKRELLHTKYWNTDLKQLKHPRAIVFIAHGLGEHCGWYDIVAQPLMDQGILVFGHDHVGHGRSEGERCYITNVMDYVRDVADHIEKVKSEHECVPVLIVGHSMGGLIALLTAMENPSLIDGLALIGPLITVDPRAANPFIRALVHVMAWLCPRAHVSKISPDVISRDKEVVKSYQADPLIYHNGGKAGLLRALLSGVSQVQGRLHEIKCPLLTVHGSDDKLCGVDGAQMLHAQSCSTDKTLSIYPGAYHQVHHELEADREKCIREITDWIMARV